MSIESATIIADLAPTGVLRATVNLGNRLLVQGTPEAPTGVTVDVANSSARAWEFRWNSSVSPTSRRR